MFHALSRSQWIMFDLGAQHHSIYSARLHLMPPAPPSPPLPPPSPPPSSHPSRPPPPSPSPSPSPPPCPFFVASDIDATNYPPGICGGSGARSALVKTPTDIQPFTIAIDFLCDALATNLDEAKEMTLWGYGGSGDQSKNTLSMTIGRDSSVTSPDSKSRLELGFGEEPGRTLAWYWTDHGLSDTDVCSGTFHTVTATWHGTLLLRRLYYDGALVAEDSTATSAALTNSNLCVGSYNNESNTRFTGTLAWFRMWDEVLDPSCLDQQGLINMDAPARALAVASADLSVATAATLGLGIPDAPSSPPGTADRSAYVLVKDWWGGGYCQSNTGGSPGSNPAWEVPQTDEARHDYLRTFPGPAGFEACHADPGCEGIGMFVSDAAASSGCSVDALALVYNVGRCHTGDPASGLFAFGPITNTAYGGSCVYRPIILMKNESWKAIGTPAANALCYSDGEDCAAPSGRRLEEAVDCDLDVETDREWTTNESTVFRISSYKRPDIDNQGCVRDCERHAVCNKWSWSQQTDHEGMCLLFTTTLRYIVKDRTVGTWTSGRCSRERHPTTYHQPGWLELWVSRSLALFGTRAAVIDTTKLDVADVAVRLTEGLDPAEGRYVYLRSFDYDRELRIDGLELFSQIDPTLGRPAPFPPPLPPGTGRRLEQELPREPPDPFDDRRLNEDEEEEKRAHAQLFSWRHVWQMRNLTLFTCMNETNNVAFAKDSRQKAAMFWSKLTEEESAVACTSCITRKPTNCTSWFSFTHGYRGSHTAELHEKRRKLREQYDRDAPERRRILEQKVGESCCRTNKRTGKKECGKEHCQKAFEAKTNARMAHTLRKLHEREGPTQLSVPQLVATDVLAPYLHHDPACRDEKKRDKTGHIECIASSMVKHLAEKHGFSEDDINKRMDRYGVTVADMMTSQLKHMASSSDSSKKGSSSSKSKSKKRKPYESDNEAASAASAMRRAQKARRKLGLEEAPVKRRKAPKASWIERSTQEGRRLSESGVDKGILVGVEPLALSGKQLRMHRKAHDEFVRNQSCAAKRIVKAANLASATTGATPLTVGNLVTSAWDASLATDGSLLGRTRTIFNAIGRVGDSVASMKATVAKAKAAAPSPSPARKRRKLTEREDAYFKKVDDMVGAANRGFRVPDHIDEQWGWVAEAVDWSYWWGEAHRVGRILYDRHEWVHTHAEDTGSLPVGELPKHHKTGYALLDVNAPPTHIGTWVRSKFTGGERHAPHRRLHEKRKLNELPRAQPPDGMPRRSVIGSFLDASLNDADPLDAAWSALHYNDHHGHHVRKLTELTQWVTTEFADQAIDYGAQLAPIVFGESSGQLPSENPNPPEEASVEGLRQVGRFITYDTLLCYLYPRKLHTYTHHT